MRVAITGASGFVGSHFLKTLADHKCVVIGRQKPDPRFCSEFFEHSIDTSSDYSLALTGVDVLVHCAARAHIMKDDELDILSAYRAVNTAGTLNLATQAAKSGVKRFLFISSAKVCGEQSLPGHPFLPLLGEAPTDPYALSKYEAEVSLHHLASETGMEVTIIRPPLVYGEGVKANFASMLRLAVSGLPLPFGAVTQNLRSLVYVGNLVDLMLNCIDHPNAANQTFFVSDDEDLSTAEMLRRLSLSCGYPSRLFSVPELWLKKLCSLVGKPQIYQRLCSSLQVDISHTIEMLNWQPPFAVDEGFAKTSRSYLDAR